MLDTALGEPRDRSTSYRPDSTGTSPLCSYPLPSATRLPCQTGLEDSPTATGEQGETASEKWEIMVNEEPGNPLIIIHSISLLKAEDHSTATLLLLTEQEDLARKGSGLFPWSGSLAVRKTKIRKNRKLLSMIFSKEGQCHIVLLLSPTGMA